jgi:ArsR family transcriptional regulator
MTVIRFSNADRRRLARCCHALSDETRLRILERLSAGERCVCELTAALGGGQSRLSFHLKALKEAGLVRDRREGRWMYYALNPDAVAAVGELLERVAAGPQRPLPVLA